MQALKATDHFGDNLAALRAFQPEVARRVESTPVPETVQRTVGRDGTETFRIADESGRTHWFGFTSMPKISAAELFGNLQRDQGSVFLPGVMSGYEPRLVASRLAPFSAVFVLESSPLLIRLAMTLYDYRDLIRSGRLVFICGESLVDAIVHFFECHPGYEFPAHLFHAPHMTPADATVVRDAVERSGQVVLNHHALNVQRLQDRIAGQFARFALSSPMFESPRIALLSVEASEASIRSIGRVTRALKSLNWDCEVCIPSGPQKCHVVARMKAIAEFRPHIVLFVNSTPTQSRELLPRLLPVVSWYLPGFLPAGLNGNAAGPVDLFVASTPMQEKMLRDASLPCLRVEPGADTPCLTSPAKREWRSTANASVVLFADLPPDRAIDVNLTLPSQTALWDALGDEAARAVRTNDSTSAQRMLHAAEKRSGTTLNDSQLRAVFEELIETVLKPAAKVRACVAALRATGQPLTVYGHGWQHEKLSAGIYRGPVPEARFINDLFRRTATVVFPIATDVAIQTALDAMATGVHVVIGAADNVLTSAYPGLRDVFASVATFRRPTEVVKVLPRPAAPRLVETAERVAREHCATNRLRQIVARVQVGFEAGGASAS